MSDPLIPTWRMELPDDWEPSYMWCVQFRIPGGVQYVAALAGAVGALTLEKTWERDDTGLGAKTVARTWDNALGGQQFNVQQLDCQFIPPSVSTDEDRANLAAGIIQDFIELLMTSLVTALGGSTTQAEWIAAVQADMQAYGFPSGAEGALMGLWDAMSAVPSIDRPPYLTDCQYIDQFTGIKSYTEAHPADWPNTLTSWLIGFARDTADNVIYYIDVLLSLLGTGVVVPYAYAHGAGSGGAGFGESCHWAHHFDLRTGEHGWAIREYLGLTLGTWTSGVGFEAVLASWGAVDHKLVQIYIDQPVAVHMTHASMIYSLHLPGDSTDFIAADLDGGSSQLDLHDIVHDYVDTGDGLEIAGDGDPTYKSFFADGQCAFRSPGTGDPLGGSATITDITIEGNGIDPFV